MRKFLFLIAALMVACSSPVPPCGPGDSEVWYTQDTWVDGTCSITPGRYSRINVTSRDVYVILSSDPGEYVVDSIGSGLTVVTDLFYEGMGFDTLTHIEASFYSSGGEVSGSGTYYLTVMDSGEVVSSCYKTFTSVGYVE